MMRYDFENLKDGDKIKIYPLPSNPLHKRAVNAEHHSGYFYCEGSSQYGGADYYLGDVLQFNHGFELLEEA